MAELKKPVAKAIVKTPTTVAKTEAPKNATPTAAAPVTGTVKTEAKTEIKTAAKPAVKTAAKPAVKTAAKPAAKAAAKPAAKAAAKPAVKTAAKPAAKKAVKPAAKKAAIKETIHMQFSGKSYAMEELVKIAKDVWRYDLKQKAADLKSVELYVKPEENLAYYVMNGEMTGSFAI